MEGGALAMSQRERSRLVMITRVREKAMMIKEAAEVMGTSYRQGRRTYKRYGEEGDKGLIHRARGQPSNRGKDCKVREAVVCLYREQYFRFRADSGGGEAYGTGWIRGRPRDPEAMASGSGTMEAAKEARQAQTTARAQGSFWRAGSDGWQSSLVV